MSLSRPPRATYRIQLSHAFTFAQAAAIVPYLARLGISHVYCSPYLKARAGSLHGYDIVDHNVLNPEIGSEADYTHFVGTLAKHHLGQMIDVVPNHMGVGGDDNAWWLDVLENGQASDYADFFDIDWHPTKAELQGKLLLPFLGDHYGKVLEKGQLKLVFDAERGEFSVRYYEHRFPIDPKTYARILNAALDSLDSQNPLAATVRGLIGLFEGLASRYDMTAERRAQRYREQQAHKQRLVELTQAEPSLLRLFEQLAQRYNGNIAEPASFDLLHALLEEQAYRLAYWRVAADEINYRRFFDINSLAALRMERPEVFAATHRLILELISQGKVHALRFDHPDGLYDPAGYFQAVRDAIAVRGGEGDASLYMVAEKILIAPENLVESWPIAGTTGYDFTNWVSGLLIDQEAEKLLTQLYERVTGHLGHFRDLLFENRKLVMRTLMSGELMVLSNMLDRISEADRRTRDHTLNALRDALMDVIACFPVYRTYVAGAEMTEQDQHFMRLAIKQARRRSPAVDVSVFDLLQAVLLLQDLGEYSPLLRETVLDFVRKLQQYTSPVMAKGFEDTSFYVYNRFVALNEVGGDPRRFGVTVAEFHQANQERLRHWPQALLCSSSHDTKRSEDVRARLLVLSDIAGEWRSHILRWLRYNRNKKTEVGGELAPDGNDEYLLYQTLVGIWPVECRDSVPGPEFLKRVQSSMRKAVREAKRHTSWINPNEEYEAALAQFIDAVLSTTGQNRFLKDFIAFAQRIVHFGFFNSLSQTLLKLTTPGVPDIYQGTELWDYSLMDPDNRRPIDYARYQQQLDQIEMLDAVTGAALANRVQRLVESIEDGQAKLYLIRRVLRWRAENEELFQSGSYEPLAAEGEHARRLCAFLRRDSKRAIVAVTAKGFAQLPSFGDAAPLGERVWGKDSRIILPADCSLRMVKNLLTDEQLDVQAFAGGPALNLAAIFSHFPVALLQVT